MTAAVATPNQTRKRLIELAALFLRLGVTAFGGPTAHIAMMNDEVVSRRQWLSSDEFLDLIGATNLIPGPNSTEMAIDIGYKRGWMTEGQLVDAVAIGQLTPGPVFTTATFIGYLLHGLSGAAAATIGIFLPAFVFVALSGYLIPKIRKSKRARDFFDSVASLALMAVVTLQLGRAALVDGVTVILAAVSLFVLVKWKLNSVWMIVGGAAIGAIASRL